MPADPPAGRLTRRAALGALLAGLATLPAGAEAPVQIPRPRRRPPEAGVARSAALIEAAGLGCSVGYVVADTESGTVLDAALPDLQQPPASVLKFVTALYGLARLGPDHRFSTRLLATGPLVEGRILGDLVLAGSGDPTLETDLLGDLAARLRSVGVRGVTGRYLLWDASLPTIYRIAPDQPEYVGYNPALSGLNLNFNRVHCAWQRQGDDWTIAMDARGARFVPPVALARMRVVTRDAPLFTRADVEGREEWTVASTALGKEGSRWLPVRQPTLHVGEVFRTLAAAQGIDLPEAEIVASLPVARELMRLESAVLTDILRDMLRYSTNLTAEAVGLCASGAGTLTTSGRVMANWARPGLGGDATFVDHSGLGGSSRVNAGQLVRMLNRVGPSLRPLLRDTGLRDAEGNRREAGSVRVLAKSGTLNFASALAGYIERPGARGLTFAILAADPVRRAALHPDAREKPEGGRAWTKSARRMIDALVANWADPSA